MDGTHPRPLSPTPTRYDNMISLRKSAVALLATAGLGLAATGDSACSDVSVPHAVPERGLTQSDFSSCVSLLM